MNNKRISFVTAFVFIFVLVSGVIPARTKAYESQSYSRELIVQLKSMSSPSLTLILNGDYSMNGNILISGTILNITAEPSNLLVNGEPITDVYLVPQNASNTITIYNGPKALNYLGKMRLKAEDINVTAYNTIDIENYLKGVVPYEMSEYYPIEALKAQAIAARNFAIKKMGTRAPYGYDFDDTVLFQVYGGYNPFYKRAIQAVEETRGMVILYDSKLIEAMYTASNGGYAEASENVWGNFTYYLRGKVDNFENETWPYGDIVLSELDIDTTLKNKGYLQLTDNFIKIDIENITKFESGRIASIPVIYRNETGVENVRYFTKDSARTFLYLPSSLYTISYNEETKSYTFSGKGYGHGLGMSQIGAKQRAQAGQSYQDILKFYYEGAYIETINGSGAVGPVENQEAVSIKPEVRLVTQPNTSYKTGDNISINVAAPNYKGRVEYRVIIYNGTTKTSTQLYNTPASGYYNRSFQPTGTYLNTIKIPVTNMRSGAYNITVLVRKAGTSIPYDSYVKTGTFTVTEGYNAPSRGGTGVSSTPKLTMLVPPVKEYAVGDTISINVTSPNYGGKVEYRVMLYNGTTKKTSELWNTPATGYYYKGWQPSGNYNFNIHWPVKNMIPGAYSMTVLVRRAGSTVPYDSYVKTEAFWVKN